ncbi:ABC transporter substrate-binding protein [Lacisediminimonas sp.]|uniref:ABC transporter substrate-binding protein n=1 Tax=Lacisediminimonas sp. TaxID=3060582 RepID=UPI00271AAB3B|nr:ABC transporter substrate-binding protein [Lacisediminimonas sp.]MDO8301057.1 ABC transporter substrate-binding protein [Lacisediminimonas sp.]MDO9217120.1 ABC transporter substrate-binding protein [Lacisediminimonas sp.]
MHSTRTGFRSLQLLAKGAAVVLAASVSLSAAQAAELKIGYFGPLSGPVAVYGTESLAGVNFALEEIARNGMIAPHTIKLISADDRADPGAAAQAVRRMIEVDEVIAILGGQTSAGTAAAIEVSRAAKIPQLSPLAVDPALTKQNNPWFARIAPSADQFSINAVQWMVNSRKAKSAYLLVRNDNWGNPLADAFEAKAKEMGMVIKGRVAYEPTAREFKPMLQKMAATNPDFVAVLGYYTETGLMVKQMSELGVKLPVFAMTAPGVPQYLDIAGPAANGTYGSLYYYSGSIDSDNARRFVRNWQAKFNRPPSQYEGMGYDAAYVLADSIKRANAKGKVTPQSIRDAIFGVKDFQGATGPITILPSGDAKRPMPFVQVQGKDIKLDYLVK